MINKIFSNTAKRAIVQSLRNKAKVSVVRSSPSEVMTHRINSLSEHDHEVWAAFMYSD